MKVKTNIELWDNTTMAEMEVLGLTTKFLEVCYQAAFEQLVKEMCSESPGMEYAVSVEVEDNAVN